MTNHTPGPWYCIPTSYHAHDYRLIKPDKTPLPYQAEANDHSEARANARLIAAAPDLLAALSELSCIVQGLLDGDDCRHSIDSFTLQPARAAIAKAKGEA